MMQSRLMNILRSPIISEKANTINEQNHCLAVKVLPDATKAEIKKAVELCFDTKVKSVNVLNVRGKKRRSAHGFGVRSNWKKAYVTLAEGRDMSDLEPKMEGKESN